MTGRFVGAAAACAAALFVLAPAPSSARPWALSDIAQVRAVVGVRIDPSGARVLYGVDGTDPRTNEEEVTWYLRSVARADDAPLAVPASSHPDAPAWSPDGTAIAWLDASRLWRYEVGSHALRALTAPSDVVLAFAWSPDGRRIAVTRTSKDAGAPSAAAYWLDPLASGVAVTRPRPYGLAIVDAATGATAPIANSGSFGGEAAPATPVWLPDGRRIAIGLQPTAYYADYERLRYVMVDTGDGSTTPVGGAYSVLPGSSSPAVDAGGRIAYVHTSDGTTSGRTDVYAGDDDVSAPLDRDFWSCGASRVATAGGALFASALDGVAMRVYRFDAGSPRAITPGDASVDGYSIAANGRVAYVLSAPDRLPEVFVADADGSHAAQLTHASALPSGVDVAPTRLVRTATSDGHELVAQLTQTPGERHPLIVELHGGPQCSDTLGFSPIAQWYATNGYAFLRPNPRGSDGYGQWSYKAIVGDFGNGPLADVRATIASALAGGGIDATRMFVEGGSYGGYLTSWAVTHDDGFRAAVAAYPVVDLPLFSALTRSPGIARRFFGSAPLGTADARERLRAQSPTAYADGLHTPLLLIAGLRDAQAPYPQAIAFYRILSQSGKNVQMLVYPQAGHGSDDTAGQLDELAHTAGWFAAYGGLDIPGAIRPPR
jgi:dipeptidyl aminopeptidase/acylaminoacyl peptidase